MMITRFGHVAYTKLGIRQSGLINFCKDFEIDILSQIKDNTYGELNKDSILDDNFVYF